VASLENRTGYWNIIFYFGGQRYLRSLRTKDEKEDDMSPCRHALLSINRSRVLLHYRFPWTPNNPGVAAFRARVAELERFTVPRPRIEIEQPLLIASDVD